MAETWTIRRALDWTRGYLGRKGDEHPRLSTAWLLSAATGLSRVELYVNFDKPLNPEELARLHTGIERRAKGEPLQYVTGEMPFRHIVLHCEPGVLIPRPETEILVDCALEGVDAAIAEGASRNSCVDVLDAQGASAECPQQESLQAPEEVAPAEPGGAQDASLPASIVPGEESASEEDAEAEEPVPDNGVRVLEVGVGTGCISLSLASERPGTHVVATDLSPKAIELAGCNAAALGLERVVELVECDLASGVDQQLMGSFDVLVSNPPYIPTPVMRVIPDEVAHFEPHLALDGGPDGLDVFRRLLELAPRALRPGGMFCVELFEESLDAAAALVREQGGWASVEVVEDLTHRPRVLVAVREA